MKRMSTPKLRQVSREQLARSIATAGTVMILVAIVLAATGFNPFRSEESAGSTQLCASGRFNAPQPCYYSPAARVDFMQISEFALVVAGVGLIFGAAAIQVMCKPRRGGGHE